MFASAISPNKGSFLVQIEFRLLQYLLLGLFNKRIGPPRCDGISLWTESKKRGRGSSLKGSVKICRQGRVSPHSFPQVYFLQNLWVSVSPRCFSFPLFPLKLSPANTERRKMWQNTVRQLQSCRKLSATTTSHSTPITFGMFVFKVLRLRYFFSGNESLFVRLHCTMCQESWWK